MSYGICEPLVSALPEASATTFQSWAQQANAEGISWLASSGDSGAAACDPFGDGAPAATQGFAVNLPASIPEVTGVGGTAFQSGTGSYWAATNGANGGSALSYIPEEAWNEVGSIGGAASGGGASIDFAKPSWQMGLSVPDDGARDVPDVAFAASVANGYIIAEDGQLSLYDPSFHGVVGGTSGAAPLFAGVVVLLNQYLTLFKSRNPVKATSIRPFIHWPRPPLTSSTTLFREIISAQYTPVCPGSNSSFGYSAGPGYDQVTGLGSVDAYNLIHEWPTTAGQAPLVNTGVATVTFPAGSGDTLAGRINANGLDTHAYFLYATSPNLVGASQTPSVDIGSGITSVGFSASVSGLTANKTYFFQLVATNSAGTVNGSIVIFTTAAIGRLPIVTTLPPFGVTRSGAVMSGTVSPNASDTHYWFNYGTSTTLSPSTHTASIDAGSGSSANSATASIAGLASDATYYFQLQASNSAGTASGSILSFTTNSRGQAPVVATGQASGITANDATLGGALNPNGLDTHYWFVCGAPGVGPNQFQTNSYDAGSGNQPMSVSVPLTGLLPNTTYLFELIASNSAGSNAGFNGSFTTSSSGSVSTGPVSNITGSSATIAGTLNPGGQFTRYWLLYGESPLLRFAKQTSTMNAGSGTSSVPVSASLTGLSPGRHPLLSATSL